VIILVVRVLEGAEEDEARRDRGVQDTEEDERRNHEREGDFLVNRLQRAKSWCSHVLVTDIRVDYGADNAEDNDFGDGARPESFGEIAAMKELGNHLTEADDPGEEDKPRILHLSDEAGEGDLPDKGITDVQESIESENECGAGDWNRADNGITTHSLYPSWSQVTRSRVIAGGVVLDTCEDSRKEHRDECEEGRGSAKLGQHVKRPWQRTYPADHSHDDTEANGSARDGIISCGHGVQVFGANQDVKALNKLDRVD